jgi:uncharacterized cupredoxin-like copper-binding protein
MSCFKLVSVIGMGLVIVVAGACGDDGDDDTGGGMSLRAELDEYSIGLDKSAVAPGEASVTAENVGDMDHELVVARTDFASDALPVAEGSVDEERIETQGGEIVGEIEEFPAGDTETETFEFTAGEYVLFCNVPGHYELGMHTKLTVQ